MPVNWINTLSVPAVILMFLTASVLLISRDWRLSIAALALQYVSITFLVALSWPIETAAVKLVAGWMAGAVLGLALIGVHGEGALPDKVSISFVLFRVFLVALVGLVALSIAPKLIQWMPGVTIEQSYGGLLLIFMGLLHLGLTAHPLRVILGLLTVLGGFEILYAVVESSALVTGLLAAVTLGLAMVGAYLLTAPTLGEIE